MADSWRKINVSLRNQELEAWVSVPFSGEEGQMKDLLTAEDVRQALKAKSVSTGILADQVDKIFRESLFDQDIMVAQGTLPQPGRNGKIEYYFRTERDFSPKEDDDGRIDFHEVSFLENIQKGQKLCRRIPPTNGKSGRSLLGKEIKAPNGHDAKLPMGPNTEYSKSDGPDVLEASTDGCVTLNSTHLVEVQPLLEIKGDVDFNTGNINFNGTLVVGGDVKAGFSLEVTGDLEIGGSVEDAVVKAGGNALVKKGFIGHGKGLIETGGELTLKFAQNQVIRTGGDLILGGELMHCETRVGGDIVASGRKGAIIGGNTMAEGSIEVPQLGSVTYTKTFVHAGCDFKTEERLNEISREMDKVGENEEKVKKALYALSKLRLKLQGNLPAEQQKLYERLRDTMNYYPKFREKLGNEVKQLESKATEQHNASVKVTGVLYPGVKIAIGKFSKLFSEKQGHTTYREARGEIVSGA
jgi:uncharacterized protein (DUF342 family)